MPEFNVGDKVILKDTKHSSRWEGLRAIITGPASNGWMVRMDEGDKRADGYDTEPFVWPLLELRSDNGVTLTEVTDATERISALEALVTQLRTQVSNVGAERRTAQDELEAFKETVVEVASRYAVENDWCSTVQEALEEMGLSGKRERNVRISGTVTVTVPICADADDLDLRIDINGDSIDTYGMEMEFDD